MGHVVWASLGRWRSQLVLRGYALCVLMTALHQYHWPVRLERRSLAWSWPVLQRHLDQRPLEEHLVSLAMLALLLLGGRLLTLIAGAVALTALVRRNMAEPWLFPAVEYVLFALVPWFALGVAVAEVVRARATGGAVALRAAHVDRAIVGVARVALLTTMGFVVLHKLNTDFFDSLRSCERVITGWLEENWGAWGTSIRDIASPRGTIAIEASVPLLLLWWPALGIIVASGFFAMLGLVGAPSTAGIVMVLSWSFLAHTDIVALRRWRSTITAGAGATGLVAFGLLERQYQGTTLSREMIALVLAVSVVPGWCALALLRNGRSTGETSVASLPGEAWVTRTLPAIALAVLLANGMAPYVGLRFNYSFAMWSNLRADQHRWNSLLVPAWTQWWPVSRRYVDLRQVTALPVTMPVFEPGPVPASRFVAAMAPLVNRAGTTIDLDVVWAASRSASVGPIDSPAVQALIAAMRTAPADAHVDVQRAIVTLAPAPPVATDADTSPYETRFEPALFSPTGFRRALAATARRRESYDIVFDYAGKTHHVAGTLTDRAFGAFVAGLGEDNRFPPKLARTGPQRCFH